MRKPQRDVATQRNDKKKEINVSTVNLSYLCTCIYIPLSTEFDLIHKSMFCI
jgi:hypothetical protein